MRFIGRLGREEDSILGDLSRRQHVSSRPIDGEDADPEEPFDDADEDDLTPDQKQGADEIEAMSVAELAREAAESIALGDDVDYEDEAAMWYTRATAMGQLATLKAIQSLTEHPPSAT